MPVIRIADDVFKRLQDLAVPFVDSPNKVIERLLGSCPQASLEPSLTSDETNALKTNPPADIYYNVAIIGIAGSGKSELINYLFDKKGLVKTDIGKPVTQCFQGYYIKTGKLPIQLFDSRGLTIEGMHSWIENLEVELSGRSTSAPAENWFHTIIYCVNCASSRIQETELEIIKIFVETGHSVVVALTKVDMITLKEEEDFSLLIATEVNKLKKSAMIPVVPVCSVAHKTRTGEDVQCQGKNRIFEEISNGFWGSIIQRIPRRCRELVQSHLENWRREQVEKIKTKSKSGHKIKDIKDEIIASWNEDVIYQIVKDEITRTMKLYESITNNIQSEDGAIKETAISLCPRIGDGIDTSFSFKALARMSGIATFISTVEAAFLTTLPAIPPVYGGVPMVLPVTVGTAMGPAMGPAAFLLPAAIVVISAVALPWVSWRSKVQHTNHISALMAAVEKELTSEAKLEEFEDGIRKVLEDLREMSIKQIAVNQSAGSDAPDPS